EQWLSGSGPEGLRFADEYPSAFAAELLRLVALYPVTDQQIEEFGSDLGPWLLVHCADGVVIGTISCARRGDDGEVSVGYDLASSYWGHGYATEALGTVIEHLLSLPDIARVTAETTVDHVASRRVMEKAGMLWQRDEVDRSQGREVKLAHYAVDRPDPL
ncbi:MAG TPA: GNAT family N-acetyltransferase, partial [Pseudonocardia sp.]